MTLSDSTTCLIPPPEIFGPRKIGDKLFRTSEIIDLNNLVPLVA